MAVLQSEALRILSADSLGETLLEMLELRLAVSESAPKDKSMREASGASDLAKAVRGALRDILGNRTRLVAVDRQDPLIDQTVIDLIERVPPIVHARRDRLSEENIQILVDSYLKAEPTLRARHAIEHDNARERARFIEEVVCLTSRDLAEMAGHRAENSSATAARWKKAGRVFALPFRGADLFPAFQFGGGLPLAVIAHVLAALPEMSPWQIAFWFTSSNSWLSGMPPADRLSSPEAVIVAAKHEAEPLVG